jgi:hypothetical protein
LKTKDEYSSYRSFAIFQFVAIIRNLHIRGALWSE